MACRFFTQIRSGGCLFIAVFFLAVLPLFAQESEGRYSDVTEDAFYYIEEVEGEIRFMQRFTWGRDEYDYRYEVTIEQKEDDGSWKEILRESREENYIEVSLPPGNYRYQVVVYNLLDKEEYAMDMLPFEIFLAVQPGIVSVSPHEFLLDEDTEWEIDLTGRNFEEGAELFLQQGNRRITPRETEFDPQHTGARLIFALQDLVPGRYTVCIKNPGGLESAWEHFNIAWRKPFDLNLSAGYAPLIPLTGELNKVLENTPMPLGFIARISFVPFKRQWGYLGVELAPSWNFLSAPISSYKVRSHVISVQLHGLYQRWFIRQVLALNVRLGAGFSTLADMYVDYGRGGSEHISATMFSADGGISLQWLFYKSWFVEIGADYTHFFAKDNANPGYLRPAITVGWQF